VYGQGVNEHPTDTAVKNRIVSLEDEDVAVILELSQPQNVESEKSGTPSLGFQLQ
jgi:MADS-box transcription factor